MRINFRIHVKIGAHIKDKIALETFEIVEIFVGSLLSNDDQCNMIKIVQILHYSWTAWRSQACSHCLTQKCLCPDHFLCKNSKIDWL